MLAAALAAPYIARRCERSRQRFSRIGGVAGDSLTYTIHPKRRRKHNASKTLGESQQSITTDNMNESERVRWQDGEFATLDDVADFMLLGAEQLYTGLFQRLEQRYDGVILHGTQDVASSFKEPGYWGRTLDLPTGETFQARFSPLSLLDGDAEEPLIVKFATRIRDGDKYRIACFLGFASDIFNHHSEELSLQYFLQNHRYNCRAIGCRGLNVLMASIFRRKCVPSACAQSVLGSFNAQWYESIQSTSFSLVADDSSSRSPSSPTKRGVELEDHKMAASSAPGWSIIHLMGELLDVDFIEQTTDPPRSCEIKGCNEYSKQCFDYHLEADLDASNKGNQRYFVGTDAEKKAFLLADMLSANGIVNFRSSPHFKDVLPDRILAPYGMPLILAMAVNLAINYSKFPDLKAPSDVDVYANNRLDSILKGSHYASLPHIKGRSFCIDVVVQSAWASCLTATENNNKQRQRNLDNICFWQRVGQFLITSHFGRCQQPRAGESAWRVVDPIAVCNEKIATSKKWRTEGSEKTLSLLSTSMGNASSELVSMLLGVEHWLRSGITGKIYRGVSKKGNRENGGNGGNGGNGDTPDNAEWNYMPEKARTRAHLALSLSLGHLSDTNEDTTKQAKTEANTDAHTTNLYAHMCTAAMQSAISECESALLLGTQQHLKHEYGAYIVSRVQDKPCTDCERPIHVLQGILFSTKHSMCTGCCLKRCLSCLNAYCDSINNTMETEAVGSRCWFCGADPARVTVSCQPTGITRTVEKRTPVDNTDTRWMIGQTGDGHTSKLRACQYEQWTEQNLKSTPSPTPSTVSNGKPSKKANAQLRGRSGQSAKGRKKA